MGNGDQFFKNASKRLDVDANGTFDVVAHGSTQKIEVMGTSKNLPAPWHMDR